MTSEASTTSKDMPAGETWQVRLRAAVVTPIQAFRIEYLPPMMVYFAAGAMGITAIASQFWVKNALTMLTPADLAAIAIWLTLPWSIKMVFGELVDSVPILGSQRRAYIFIGAGLIAASLLMLAGTASGWLTFAAPQKLYIAASILTVIGIVVQDVAADAMTTEVVPHTNSDGTARSAMAVAHDLAMVQVLGRLAFSFGLFAVAGIGGLLASWMSPGKVFLIGLVVPVISVLGALRVKTDTAERRATDWHILGGGLAFGAAVTLLGLFDVPLGQEIIFFVSLGVIGWMLSHVTQAMPAGQKQTIFFAAVIIFMFRVTPGVGDGYFWFSVEKLGFDEAFQGVLGQIGTTVGLVAGWLVADAITRQRMTSVMLWLTVLGTVLSLPTLFLAFGGHQWTERVFGFGARSIAIVDTAAASPLDMVGMIPLLTLVAKYAPAGNRATWFALMSSFMNLALVGGGLLTKYLNQVFVVTRQDFTHLPALVIWTLVLGFVIPVAAIMLWRHRVD